MTRRQILAMLGSLAGWVVPGFRSRHRSSTLDLQQSHREFNHPAEADSAATLVTSATAARIVNWRQGHSTTVLADGRVLVAGGLGHNSAEVYDPASSVWSATGAMTAHRCFHSATLLDDGRVLVAGGLRSRSNATANESLASAELYDPATGTWTPTGPMRTTRDGHAAQVLPTGQVLVSGGTGLDAGQTPHAGFRGLRSTEAYDPVTGSWSPLPAMRLPRSQHTPMLLPDGRVLMMAGTASAEADTSVRKTVRNTGEVFDPRAGAWTLTSDMPNPTGIFLLMQVGLLPDGRMVGLMGSGANNRVVLYDPLTDRWDNLPVSGEGYRTSMSPPWNPSVSIVVLPDGRVLASGGVTGRKGTSAATSSIFDPITAAWTPTGSMTGPRQEHTTVVLRSGKVLAFGGIQRQSNDDPAAHVLTSEVYDPLIGSWSPTGP